MSIESKIRTVLITGASSGIGYEFAKIFADHQYILILTARDETKLLAIKKEFEDQYNTTTIILTKDLSDINEANAIHKYIMSRNIKVDVLINTAGAGVYGEFKETDFTKESDMIKVNILALTYLTKIFLKEMLKDDSGSIINVASTAAFKPGPLMSVYYATKAYVLSFSESIAAEICDTNVSLTVLCPGPTRTDFMKKSSFSVVKDLKIKKMQTASEVAIYGYKAMLRKELIAIPGISNRVLTFLLKFFPRKLFAWLMFRMKHRKENIPE
jgi:short-subunit dehydrogenase